MTEPEKSVDVCDDDDFGVLPVWCDPKTFQRLQEWEQEDATGTRVLRKLARNQPRRSNRDE